MADFFYREIKEVFGISAVRAEGNEILVTDNPPDGPWTLPPDSQPIVKIRELIRALQDAIAFVEKQ